MRRLGNKKGISEILSYVLLIVIGISISVLVYNYIRGQIPQGNDGTECDEATSLVVLDYTCDPITKIINLTLENHGRFSISGFTAKLGNSTTTLATCKPRDSRNNEGTFFIGTLNPGQGFNLDLYYAHCSKLNEVNFIEITPINSKGSLCNDVIIHDEIKCPVV